MRARRVNIESVVIAITSENSDELSATLDRIEQVGIAGGQARVKCLSPGNEEDCQLIEAWMSLRGEVDGDQYPLLQGTAEVRMQS